MLSGFTSDVWRTGSNAVRTRCGQLAHEDKALREPKPKKGQEAKALNGSSKSAHRIPGGCAHARKQILWCSNAHVLDQIADSMCTNIS